jgi:uncharacterized protein
MQPPKSDKELVSPVTKSKSLWKIIIVIVIVLLAVGLFFLYRFYNKEKVIVTNHVNTHETLEPEFTLEGSLSFVSGKDSSIISKIGVEIADDDASTEKGLMFRRSMADSLGMLFIFNESEARTFWMKNTYIPLDIIFIDEKHSIVCIQKDAVPFSEASLPCKENAKYVVEVNAGYTENYSIKVGDGIRFIQNKN